ncbi:MAG: YhcH/YjgK/YiaL family protein [Candidatus Omnitrophica bacterium]|nr:YhcH/YjgK/YiaL family protein [Candidatus Omnitrophota bacterium]
MAIIGMLPDLLRQKIGTGLLSEGLRYAAQYNSRDLLEQGAGFAQRRAVQAEDVVVIEQAYLTKPPTAARFEAHRRYYDIQYLIGGEERMYVRPVDQRHRLETAYDEENDCMFFQTTAADFACATCFVLQPGMAAIFAPSDAHAPGIQRERACLVHKIVVKVRGV